MRSPRFPDLHALLPLLFRPLIVAVAVGTIGSALTVSVSGAALATAVQLDAPTAGYLLVGSVGDNSVMRYDEITGEPAPSIGNRGARFVAPASGGLFFPRALIMGPDRNLYVSMGAFDASPHDSGVLQFEGTTGVFLRTFVSQGSGGGLGSPRGLVFGSDRNLYVSNDTNGANERGKDIETFAGDSGRFLDAFVPPNRGGLNHPQGLVFGPDGNIYVADGYQNAILRYDGRTGRPKPSAGNKDAMFVTPGSGGLSLAVGLVFGPDGNLYVTSAGTDSVLRYDGTTGAFLDVFVPAGDGGISFPLGLVFGPDNNLYVSSGFDPAKPTALGTVLRYDGTTGAFIDAFIPSGSGGLAGPSFLIFTRSDPRTLAYTPSVR